MATKTVASNKKNPPPQAPAKEHATDKKVIARSENAPPQSLMERMAKDSRKGLSSDAADNLVPMVYILQSNSPQTIKRNPAYMEGAEGGMIWLRNCPDPIVPGDEGILFQPCHFSKDVVEWIDRDDGGGFVGRHAFEPGENMAALAERLGAKRVEDEKNSNRVSFVLPNNHQLVETRYHVGYIYGRGNPMPYVIPLKSTGHTFSKGWMFGMNSRTLPSGEIPPSWAALYRLTTEFKSNASGDWFGWKYENAGWIEKEEDYDRGEALNKAFATGEKDYEAPIDDSGRVASGGGDDGDDM
jgi:hypothetical protein